MNAFFLFCYAELNSEGQKTDDKAVQQRTFNYFIEPWEVFVRGDVTYTAGIDKLGHILLPINQALHNDDYVSAGSLLQTWKEYRQSQVSLDKETEAVLNIYIISAQRLCRKVSIEAWEDALEDFNWSLIGLEYQRNLILLIGLVYLNEKDRTLRKKCKFWLERLLQDKEIGSKLWAHYYLMLYYYKYSDPSSAQEFLHEAQSIEKYVPKGLAEENLWKVARLHTQLILVPGEDKEKQKVLLKELENNLLLNTEPVLVTDVCLMFAFLARNPECMMKISEDLAKLSLQTGLKIFQKLEQSFLTFNNNPNLLRRAIALRTPLMIYQNQHKEAQQSILEIVSFLKKNECWGPYTLLTDFMTMSLSATEGSEKAFQYLMSSMDSFKQDSVSRYAEPIVHIITLANKILLNELKRPGISWCINHLYSYLQHHNRFLSRLSEQVEITGKYLFHQYQKEFITLNEIAKNNVRTSLYIHKLQIQMLRVSAKFHQDTSGMELANNMLRQIDDMHNPLYFINADWEDFKDVSFDIRNKIINRSITITKGDLPLAAEHLQFSYRNLRSYISLNEVNRLGFFLQEKKTSSKSLEEGIRLIFHDLYLKGNIFEAVFDMPEFLIFHAQTGFLSEEMEEKLEIKPSTAKKYIKIMTEIGLIEAIRDSGRKLRYKLRIEQIMHRYAESKSAKLI